MPKHFHDDQGAETPVELTASEQAALPQGESRSLADWGEAKGFLPQWASARGAGGEKRINPEFWKLGAVMAFKQWDLTTQVSEAALDAALAEVLTHVHR
jgi:hypothetical protein